MTCHHGKHVEDSSLPALRLVEAMRTCRHNTKVQRPTPSPSDPFLPCSHCYFLRMSCLIPANPDISGIGVRVAIYAQNFLSFLPAVYSIWNDGQVDAQELQTTKDISITILVTAFAILISTVVQAQTYGLSSFHVSVILNLSWMNNTNTFIYFMLYVYHRSGLSGHDRIEPTWQAWREHLLGWLSWRRIRSFLLDRPGTSSMDISKTGSEC
jgi:hypothetical protein